MFTSTSNHPAAMNAASGSTVSSKLEKDTVYMPSSVAARVLGGGARDARQSDDGESDRKSA